VLLGVGALALRALPRPPRPSAAVPAGPDVDLAAAADLQMQPELPCVAPPGPGPSEPASAQAPGPETVMWAGPEDEPPAGPATPPQDPLPTGVPLQRLADKLGDVFTALKEPPAEKGFERHFQQYTDNLSTKLQLEGDRGDLSVVRMMFFDRRTDDAAAQRAQDGTLSRFLEAVGASDAQAREALEAVALASKTGAAAPQQEKQWDLGPNRLVVTVVPAYGSGFIELRRAASGT
jgi:hypothetical protein